MSKLIYLIPLIIITFLSCDGRDRAYKNNVEILKSNNLFESFSEQSVFIPNQPVEIFTDTILTNGFHVKLKYNSIDNDFITLSEKSNNNSIINNNYKNFEAKFQIFKNELFIAEKTLNKETFINNNSSAFFEDAIMQFVWIDYENSSENYITLNTSFHIPETEVYKDFIIQIDEFGNIKIREINLIKKVS